MPEVQIISVKPDVDSRPGVLPDNWRHSKFVHRRRYVEEILAPQMSKYFKTQIVDAVIPPRYTVFENIVTYNGNRLRVVPETPLPCLLSHVDIWNETIKNWSVQMVLEDDAKLAACDEQYVAAAVQEFEKDDRADILYLLYACPYHPTGRKSYNPNYRTIVSDHLMLIRETNDLAGTAAYVVKPAAALKLVGWIGNNGTRSPDCLIHTLLREGQIQLFVMTEYHRGFVFNDHFAEWNHKHDPAT